MVSAKDLREKENREKLFNKKTGYYKWFAKKEELETLLKPLEVKFEDIESYLEKVDDMYCIYIGIAVRESVGARLNWHVNDRHTENRVKNGTLSTLRKSISSLIAHNQFDKEKTNDFIDLLKIEYKETDYPIKSQEAKEYLHNIEREAMSKHLYILNIQENYFEQAKDIKKKLRKLRKESKKLNV